ncbi:MAG: hypothetical protein ABI610_02870 [Acidobacteriota bacterium]
MSVDREELRRLARESGRHLGELGVRPDDARWIRTHAETVASLAGRVRASPLDYIWRIARRAARKAR